MKKTRLIMGMPITIDIVGAKSSDELFSQVFDYFREVDRRFSPYKKSSELVKLNQGLPKSKWSKSMREVLALCEETKRLSGGYFDTSHGGKLDPSGLVKGWSINQAAKMIAKAKVKDFYVEAGGDIQVSGKSETDSAWVVGIRNPFNIDEVVKVVKLTNQGMATSGIYIRGQHIYDPVGGKPVEGIVSLSVIGPNIYEADRFATAAFAMGERGIDFIEELVGFEGYAINDRGIATLTNGFSKYLAQ